MLRLLKYLNRQSKTTLVASSLVFILLLGVLDYVTGAEVSFSIFYLLPIALITWFVGRWAGLAASLLSATVWLLADLLTRPAYSHPAIPYWNAGVRLGFFLIATYALASLRTARERQDDLSHFVVHDLRSPLSNVMTGLQIVQEQAEETLDDNHKELVDICLISCNRMLTLINSLLDLARLESGKMPLHPGPTVVRELVEASLGQVSVWAKRNQVTLASYLDPGVETVYADPEVALRVLVNLLSNAIKFSPSDAPVTVRVVPAEAHMLAFSVTDQGKGIPEEWADRVFDKFGQAEAYKAGSAAGSGLGLTFCRLAVEAQGGRIWLKSEIDTGTTVTFTLPADHNS